MNLLAVFLAASSSVMVQDQPTDKVREYLALTQSTLENPITHQELRHAVLSEKGIASITEIFKRSMADSLLWNGAVVTPELGGEATLTDGKLNLIQYPDPVHPVIRRLAGLEDDPQAMLRFLDESEEGRRILRTTGGLHALLYQLSSGAQATDAQRSLLDRIIFNSISIHFKTWSVEPETQAAEIEKNDWRGRYVGFWHIHPPRWGRQGLVEGMEPSMADMTNAVQMGQFLTIVFQPEGFDFYDLSPLSTVQQTRLDRAEVISYRSPEWSRAFAALFGARSRSGSRP